MKRRRLPDGKEKDEKGEVAIEAKDEVIKKRQKTQKQKRWELFQREIEVIEKDDDMPLPTKEQGLAFPVGLVGRRKSGKTFLLDMLMKTFWRGEFHKIYVLSKTAKYQDYFKTWKGNIDYVEEWSFDFFEKVKNDQISSEMKRKVLIVIDDMSSDMREKLYSSRIDEFSFIGRHFRVSVVWLAQKITLFTPGFRQESDAFIMFREENMSELRLLHREWGFGDMDDFVVKLIDNLKERYEWIMLRNVGGTIKLCRLPTQE